MTLPSVNEKRVNPEDELFWKKVREAHDTVRPVEGLEITVQVGTYEATIQSVPIEHTDSSAYVVIYISEFVPDPPTLVVP